MNPATTMRGPAVREEGKQQQQPAGTKKTAAVDKDKQQTAAAGTKKIHLLIR